MAKTYFRGTSPAMPSTTQQGKTFSGRPATTGSAPQRVAPSKAATPQTTARPSRCRSCGR